MNLKTCALRSATITMLSLAACSSSASLPGASDAEFVGLDPAVVNEVLQHPVATQRISDEEGTMRSGMAQGIVRNFIICRDAFRVYEDWLTAGTPSALGPNPIPSNPVEPSNGDFAGYYNRLDSAVKSGEVASLRTWLIGTPSCGEWIPATPNDVNGPTIKDEIETQG